MPKITKVYTRTGDDGTTGLGDGQRVPKDSLRIEVIGAVDELNAALGCAIAYGTDEALRAPLAEAQNCLFHLGSDLCMPEKSKVRTPVPHIEERHVTGLEYLMDHLSLELDSLENFVLPGGSETASRLHVARSVCRRAERLAVALSRAEEIGPFVVRYLNRFSDALFVMARYENHKRGTGDVTWDSRA